MNGRNQELSTSRAHAYHQPRAKVASTSIHPGAAVNSAAPTSPPQESSDLPLPKPTHAPETFQIDIPADYQAVMRKDYFTDSYVMIAPKRHLRPSDFAGSERRLIETADSPRLDLQAEIDSVRDRQGNWKTKVVDNKFPALSLDNPLAFGKQELVIDTPLANLPLGLVGRDQLLAVLQTYQKRFRTLSKIRGIKYVTIFKNDGVRAGASLAHSHSQIFATAIIPTKTTRISQAAEQYFQKHGQNPYATLIDFELREKVRVISQSQTMIAICPFAPRWPLDTWILPRQQTSSLAELDDHLLGDLADTLYPLIHKLTRYRIDYNFYLENGVSPNHRFAIKLQARSLNWWAGFEVASDMAINPIPPEIAAAWYRDAR